MERAPPPRLTVVVLTYDEERNIGACLASLANQTERAFEVLVVDAASPDRTLERVEAMRAGFPVRLRVRAAPRRLSVGEARALGVQLAMAPWVAFLSADAEAAPDWVAQALQGLADADLVYGRQEHAPRAWTLGASVRGLRYHHFPSEAVPGAEDAARLASHVNTAMRGDVPRRFRFGSDPASSAVDDLLLASKAVKAGLRATYRPGMVVAHRDAATGREELRKGVREGFGWGVHARELGLHRAVLGWGGLLALAVALLLLWPGLPAVLLLTGVLWAPAARRVWHRRRAMPLRALLLGFAASPLFDLAFLAAYLRGLAAAATHRRARQRQPRQEPPEPENLELEA